MTPTYRPPAIYKEVFILHDSWEVQNKNCIGIFPDPFLEGCRREGSGYARLQLVYVIISRHVIFLHIEVFSSTHWSQLKFPMQACKQRVLVTHLQTCILTGQLLHPTNRRAVMDNACPICKFSWIAKFLLDITFVYWLVMTPIPQ